MLYNNYVDVDVVLCVVFDYVILMVVIIKYVNFCGIVIVDMIVDVYVVVYVCDFVLVYGGVIVVNCLIMKEVVELIVLIFIEVVIVFGFEFEVFVIL